MTKAKGRVQRERGLANMSPPPAVELYVPDLARCTEAIIPVEIDVDHRLIVRLPENQRGLIEDFVIIRERWIAKLGSWRDVAQADTAHGSVHVHLLDAARHTVAKWDLLSPITCRKEVEKGYSLAHEVLRDDAGVCQHAGSWTP